MCLIETAVLEIEVEQQGPPDGRPVLLSRLAGSENQERFFTEGYQRVRHLRS